jgi:hypothetical protein
MKLTVRTVDWFLFLPLVAGLVMIAEFDAPSPDAVELSVVAKAIGLTFVTAILAVAVAAASALDRRCSEDYLFQIMANAALVAFAATMLVNLVWVIGEKVLDLPELASDNIIGVNTLAWVLAYYWFRVKGLAQ